MNEAKRRAKQAIVKRMEPMVVDTPGGRICDQARTPFNNGFMAKIVPMKICHVSL